MIIVTTEKVVEIVIIYGLAQYKYKYWYPVDISFIKRIFTLLMFSRLLTSIRHKIICKEI